MFTRHEWTRELGLNLSIIPRKNFFSFMMAHIRLRMMKARAMNVQVNIIKNELNDYFLEPLEKYAGLCKLYRVHGP